MARSIIRELFHLLPFSTQMWVHRNLLERHDPTDLGERIQVTDDLDHHRITDFVTLSHIVRYKWVLPFLEGKSCLDDGCGTGYGTYYLSKHGVTIVGVDKSKKAIRYADEHYRNPGLEFRCLNSLKTGFPNAQFDAVISFDVLEHLSSDEQVRFLQEIRRVLKPAGALYIGTPNRRGNRSSGCISLYHKRECNYAEFLEVLKTAFQDCEIFTQQLILDGEIYSNDLQSRLRIEDVELTEENFTVSTKPEGFGLLAICKP